MFFSQNYPLLLFHFPLLLLQITIIINHVPNHRVEGLLPELSSVSVLSELDFQSLYRSEDDLGALEAMAGEKAAAARHQQVRCPAKFDFFRSVMVRMDRRVTPRVIGYAEYRVTFPRRERLDDFYELAITPPTQQHHGWVGRVTRASPTATNDDKGGGGGAIAALSTIAATIGAPHLSAVAGLAEARYDFVRDAYVEMDMKNNGVALATKKEESELEKAILRTALEQKLGRSVYGWLKQRAAEATLSSRSYGVYALSNNSYGGPPKEHMFPVSPYFIDGLKEAAVLEAAAMHKNDRDEPGLCVSYLPEISRNPLLTVIHYDTATLPFPIEVLHDQHFNWEETLLQLVKKAARPNKCPDDIFLYRSVLLRTDTKEMLGYAEYILATMYEKELTLDQPLDIFYAPPPPPKSSSSSSSNSSTVFNMIASSASALIPNASTTQTSSTTASPLDISAAAIPPNALHDLVRDVYVEEYGNAELRDTLERMLGRAVYKHLRLKVPQTKKTIGVGVFSGVGEGNSHPHNSSIFPVSEHFIDGMREEAVLLAAASLKSEGKNGNEKALLHCSYLPQIWENPLFTIVHYEH